MPEVKLPEGDDPQQSGVHCSSMHSWRDPSNQDVLLEFYDRDGSAVGHIVLTEDIANRLAMNMISKSAKQ